MVVCTLTFKKYAVKSIYHSVDTILIVTVIVSEQGPIGQISIQYLVLLAKKYCVMGILNSSPVASKRVRILVHACLYFMIC